MMEEEMIEPITASQIIDDEYIEIDVEIYRIDRSSSVDDYVVLKINEAETYMSIEDAKNIASMLNAVASEVNSDGVS
jgi:hypothetical protein